MSTPLDVKCVYCGKKGAKTFLVRWKTDHFVYRRHVCIHCSKVFVSFQTFERIKNGKR